MLYCLPLTKYFFWIVFCSPFMFVLYKYIFLLSVLLVYLYYTCMKFQHVEHSLICPTPNIAYTITLLHTYHYILINSINLPYIFFNQHWTDIFKVYLCIFRARAKFETTSQNDKFHKDKSQGRWKPANRGFWKKTVLSHWNRGRHISQHCQFEQNYDCCFWFLEHKYFDDTGKGGQLHSLNVCEIVRQYLA